jgi:magnesium chelatase family protein
MLSRWNSFAVEGIQSICIEIEVDSRNGLCGQTIVGLPDTSVKESKERVFSAMKNSGFAIPLNKYLTINLAPAHIRKTGSLYDLPIALGVLQTTGQLCINRKEKLLVIGELGLDGQLKPVHGALLGAILARAMDFDVIIVPEKNAAEAALIEGVSVIPIKNLREVVEYIEGRQDIAHVAKARVEPLQEESNDFSYIKGQLFAKRGFEIAAAGGHNILMVGPPGCGKSLMAKSFPSILPALTYDELIEVIQVYSVSGKITKGSLSFKRPFRSPHHTISYAGIIGGTSKALPGEVSLAHQGVLFLDELPEFGRHTLESLRQPMEDGTVCISRAGVSCDYPADFILVASANPCPCGFDNHPDKDCVCDARQKRYYLSKLSGPLLDRFDLIIEMMPVKESELFSTLKSIEPSCEIRKRVEKAKSFKLSREIERRGPHAVHELDRSSLDDVCQQFLSQVISKFYLSARAVSKLLQVARTIADLENKEVLEVSHLSESLQFRRSLCFG